MSPISENWALLVANWQFTLQQQNQSASSPDPFPLLKLIYYFMASLQNNKTDDSGVSRILCRGVLDSLRMKIFYKHTRFN